MCIVPTKFPRFFHEKQELELSSRWSFLIPANIHWYQSLNIDDTAFVLARRLSENPIIKLDTIYWGS